MESFDVKINKPEDFDAAIQTSLPELGDICLITKHGATQSGRTAVMLTFHVQLPDGTIRRVQAVTTMKLFRTIATTFLNTYTDEGMPLEGVGGASVFDDPHIGGD